MKFRFITKLHQFKINEDLHRGIHIFDGLRLSNSNSLFERLFYDEEFVFSIGGLEYHDLLNNSYLYVNSDTSDVKHSFKNYDSAEDRFLFLDYYMKLAQGFNTMLWLVKDNSVNTELGFLDILSEGRPITSNFRTVAFTNAKGTKEETEFTRTEINKAVSFFNSHMDEDYMRSTTAAETQYVVSTDSDRLDRLTYFLQSARSQPHVPSKIALYCTALETILTTDNSELTYKISERLALMIGQTLAERLEIFDVMKNAYKIRSSTVHGSILPNKLKDIDSQTHLSGKVDEYIRRILVMMRSDDNMRIRFKTHSTEQLNNWFNELVFS